MAALSRLVCVMVLATGCHIPRPELVCPPLSPATEPAPVELQTATPTLLEPDYGSLPKVDAPTVDVGKLFAADPTGFRKLTERDGQCLAAAHAPIAGQLERESESCRIVLREKRKRGCECPEDDGDGLLRELRMYAAQAARNLAAADALERYFQLADAEARSRLLTDGVTAVDQLRAEAKAARQQGLSIADDDELLRQRAKLLSDAEGAVAGILQLNLDLKRRLGLSVKGAERLWPATDLGVPTADGIDAEAAVRTALERRPDLLLLRAAYHGLTPDNLPAARDQLRGINPLLGGATPQLPTPRLPAVARMFGGDAAAVVKEAAAREVELRRRQLFALTADREKTAAVEVRAAAVAVQSAVRKVGLARYRADSLRAKVEGLRRTGPKWQELLATLDWYRARADVIAEAAGYHQARVRLKAAQGLLAWECAGPPAPPP